MALLGGIESGGTKTVCVVGTDPQTIIARARIPTSRDPAETLGQVADFFATQVGVAGPLVAVGIGSFGPCDPNPASSTYGHVTSTPKPGWAHVDVVGRLRALLHQRGLADVPIAFDTDVNAAALGELNYGAGMGVSSLVYVTVGTGIGGGAMVDGRLAHGMIHPEMGHIRIRRSPAEVAAFEGVCPYHGDCWEGVASGPAMAARWGEPAETLPADHPAWGLEADYVACGLHALVCVLSPGRIVLGGGVGCAPPLLPLVLPRLVDSLGGYISSPVITERTQEFVVSPRLGNDSGVVGALALAQSVRAR